MKVYIITILQVKPYQKAEIKKLRKKVFLDFKEAKSQLLKLENKWIRQQGYDKELIKETLIENIETNFLYNHHYIDDDIENIFLIEQEDILEKGLFILKKDFRYMNNQCIIGSEIPIITFDFEEAIINAFKIKEQIISEYKECRYFKKEDIGEAHYHFQLMFEDDVIELTIYLQKVGEIYA